MATWMMQPILIACHTIRGAAGVRMSASVPSRAKIARLNMVNNSRRNDMPEAVRDRVSIAVMFGRSGR